MDRRDGILIAGAGILFGITFGALVYLFARLRDFAPATSKALGAPVPPSAWAPQAPWSEMPPWKGPPPIPVVQTATPKTAVIASPSKMYTYTLSNTEGLRIMTASSERHWTVQVRNLGPAGSVAMVARDPSAMAYPTMTLQIPAGTFADLRVEPRGALFAMGSTADVQISIVASEEIA